MVYMRYENAQCLLCIQYTNSAMEYVLFIYQDLKIDTILVEYNAGDVRTQYIYDAYCMLVI